MKLRLLLMSCVLLLSVLTASIGYNAPTAYAHRSGCHRWHSCPSDSGSYVCGDLGYTSGCGGSTQTYIAPTIDYTAQGRTNGTKHADNDKDIITVAAKLAGTNAGNSDATSTKIMTAYITSPAYCDKTFTFDSGQNETYKAIYKSSYQTECNSTYIAAYAQEYRTAYNKTKTEIAAEESKKQAEQGALWGWLFFGGFITWVIYASVKK